jgi:hypothetical protein
MAHVPALQINSAHWSGFDGLSLCFSESFISQLTCGKTAPQVSHDAHPWPWWAPRSCQVFGNPKYRIRTAISKFEIRSGFDCLRKTANCTRRCMDKALEPESLLIKDDRFNSTTASPKLQGVLVRNRI